MEDVLREALRALSSHSRWILWNLFLAFIPLVISFWLFRWQQARTWFWWIGLVVFIAFLPNAPYLLTDVVHLIRATQAGYSTWVIAVFMIPVHITAILLGTEAYVMAVINQSYYLLQHRARRFVLPAELLIHALCAVGVYLGRFVRFNSWDLVTRPDEVLVITLDQLTSERPLVVMFGTFVILTVVYWVMKQITIGLLLRVRYARQGRNVFKEALD